MTNLTPQQQQDVRLVQQVLLEIRQEMEFYFKERDFILSNLQLLSFMMASPLSIAIALDNQLDIKEKTVLDYYSQSIYHIFNTQYSEETNQVFNAVPDHRSTLREGEFPELLKKETSFIVEQYPRWNSHFLRGLKALLKLEDFLLKYNPDVKPLRSVFVENMYMIVKSNLGNDAIEENRLRNLLATLGIGVSEDQLAKIIASIVKD